MREPTTSTLWSSASASPASPPTSKPPHLVLYALTIFISAFLLFEVQPLIAKEILPWFGGSAGVWTTCMLFFQLVLLAGYAYAHWLSQGRSRWIHISVLVGAALTCRIIPFDWWKPADGRFPILRILGLLVVTVGLPDFALASTSPLLQSWYAREHHAGLPYRLFSLSNFASMLALLSYPIVIEPQLRLHAQAWLWSAGFLIFAALNYWLARGSASYPAYEPELEEAPRPSRRDRIMWLLLSACASALLLAVTNHITQNVAAIPLLWVLPLAVYLLSFILTFEGGPWYQRGIFLGLFAVSLASMGFASGGQTMVNDIRVLIPLFVAGLFVSCMVCHGELARCKPAKRWLTSFYLMVALGGALGGLFVAVIAPAVFPALFEVPILLVVTPSVVLYQLLMNRDRRSPISRRKGAGTEYAQFWPIWIISTIGVLALAGYLAKAEYDYLAGARLLTRNFYGALRVTDDDDIGVRTLAHGTINHGEQFLDPARRRQPITYYAPDTGIGMLMADLQKGGPVRLGVIGLGTGTMAAWSNAGDSVRFYEINARVLEIANTQFTFLRDCPAHPEVFMGDARLSLERESAQHFDVLVVDAFSGDSIPVHLLTREAFQVYWRHLKPDGILAVHVSNKYLDLSPPVVALARQFGREAHMIESEKNDDTETFASDWVLVGHNEAARFPWIEEKETDVDIQPGLRVWTDDFSNLWQIRRR
jgi:SAM-dependent methyltransferase